MRLDDNKLAKVRDSDGDMRSAFQTCKAERREADLIAEDQQLFAAAAALYLANPFYEPSPRPIDWFALTHEQRRPFIERAEAAASGVEPLPAPSIEDAVHRVIDAFERKDRGIPQAHIAADLVRELRAALAAGVAPSRGGNQG
jgi:hypothetical protein